MKASTLVFVCLFLPFLASGQQIITETDTIRFQENDTLASVQDSLLTAQDSLQQAEDTIDYPLSSSAIESEVKYHARDSTIADIQQKKLYLYGEAHVDYEDLELNAEFIEVDWNTNVIHAKGILDSMGKLTGTPHFKDADQEFDARELSYNFKTKKGRIIELYTQEGSEGYIHGEVIKTIKDEGQDVSYIKSAKYTTCDLRDPHFYLKANKMKVIPKKRIITGGAYMVVEDVPMPMVLPFGFFPANSQKTSGLIIPTFGNDFTRGYALQGLGFYYGGSDYFDAALTSDVYTDGSYRVNLNSSYALRYKFSGGVSVSYARNFFGLKETPEFARQEDFIFDWRHQQDQKANPNHSFSAKVTIPSSSFYQNNSYNVDYISNQSANSSISFNKSFGNSPFNLTASATHSQSFATKRVDMSLPQIVFGMNRINPFKGLTTRKETWLDRTTLQYTLNGNNHYTVLDSNFIDSFAIENFYYGFSHAMPLTTTFKILKYFSLVPNITYNGTVFTRRILSRDYDDSTGEYTITNEEMGFYPIHTFTSGANLSTRLYGMFNINRFNLVAIRHQFVPTAGLAYIPDFKFDRYYTTHPETNAKLPVYDNTINSIPAVGSRALLTLNLNNNFEMKVRQKTDTGSTTKKVKLIDNFNIGGQYDMLADSYALSNIALTANTNLFNKLTVNAGMSLNPYYHDTGSVIYNVYAMDRTGKLAYIDDVSLVLSTNFNYKGITGDSRTIPLYRQSLIGYYYPGHYYNFDLPWNINLTYTMRRDLDPGRLIQTKDLIQTVNGWGELKVTEKWRVAFNTGFDITNKKITLTEFNVFRDLHCWEMSFKWIPFGNSRSYFFTIRAKANTLQDLKYEKQRQRYTY